jgi:hypothetical protein
MSSHQAAQNRRGLRRVKQATVRTEKQPYDFRNPTRTPRLGGGTVGIYWCQLTTTISAATGTWGTLTLGKVTGQTIYYVSGGGQVELSGTRTVYNSWPASFASGKTTALAPNPDGTFSISEQAC